MSSKNQAAGGSGCGLLILLALAIFVLAWAIKIGLIILGVALIIGSVMIAVGGMVLFWTGVYQRPTAQASLDEFDETLTSLSLESSRRLSSSITAWDDLQRNRGVGTLLEKAYFAESVNPATRELFDDINFHVEYGEELLSPANAPRDWEQRIDHLKELDTTALHLESLRRRVTR